MSSNSSEESPFFVDVAFDQVSAESPRYRHFTTPWKAVLMARRGEGTQPVRVAHGMGTTDVNAVLALAQTLENNRWLREYYSWDAIKLAIIDALEALKPVPDAAEGAGAR